MSNAFYIISGMFTYVSNGMDYTKYIAGKAIDAEMPRKFVHPCMSSNVSCLSKKMMQNY